MELGTVNHVTCMDEYTAAVKAAGDALVVVDFGATWCGPCKRIAPLFDQLAVTHNDVCFLKVDVDEAQDVASTLGVSSLPTFLFLRRGRTLETFSGADSARLESTIARLRPVAAAEPSRPAPAAAAKPPAPTVAAPSAASAACSASFFKGDVTSAITAARTQRRPLLVAVDAPPPHADSLRQEAEVWNNAAVQTALSQCVALRLRADSQEGRQFASLFPVLALPFVYLINPLTGAPFAALPGFTPAATLLPAIASAGATLSASAVPAAAAPAATSPSPLAASAAVVPTPASEAAPAPPSAELNDPASVEAEKARLLKKLAEVRAAKERAAQEEEKEREVRRLQEAKEAQKAKEASEERRRQLALEKAAREREADERAKARLREQIRLDRLERAKGAASPATSAPAAPTTSSPAASAPAAAASSARAPPATSVLQVRLMDGSAVKFELPSSAPLSEVRSVLVSKHGLRGAFTLLTPYPRRNYTPADEARSLTDLGLTGAVTLIVTLPEGVSSSSPGAPAGAAQGGAPASAQGWGSYLWSWVTWRSPSAAQPSAANAAAAPPSSSTSAPRPGGNSGSTQIRTLRDQKGDEDEDRKTWNGNSTQQM